MESGQTPNCYGCEVAVADRAVVMGCEQMHISSHLYCLECVTKLQGALNENHLMCTQCFIGMVALHGANEINLIEDMIVEPV